MSASFGRPVKPGQGAFAEADGREATSAGAMAQGGGKDLGQDV